MKLSDFEFELPGELIAQQPLPQRDQSRMMVLHRKTGQIGHGYFKDFPSYLQENEILVLNNSRVIPARAWGRKGGIDIEFLFLKELAKNSWEVLCRPARKVQPGDKITLSPRLQGEVIQAGKEGRRVLRFSRDDVLTELKKIGYAPLPPYIRRKKEHLHLKTFDLERYQTVFARKKGSIAAPTAGFHFTPELLENISSKGVKVIPITLDVGLATFQPVREDVIEKHHMLEEEFSITPGAAKAINLARSQTRPIIAVGTTTVRALESAADEGRVRTGRFSTKLFIYPGFRFQIIDRLLTNFHLPRSSLLMLVSALAGHEFILEAYQEAIRARYRFFSYGDCMLIL